MTVTETGLSADAVGEFDRLPPQDIPAEQSVLGGMLLSKDAIAEVADLLTAAHFYKPAHQTIYAAIQDMFGRGDPADPITVSAELTRRGELARVGGPGYVQSLVNAVPTAANAAYYAEIVYEKALLRQIAAAGTRAVQAAYSGAQGDAEEIAAAALAAISAAVTDTTEDTAADVGEDLADYTDALERVQKGEVDTGLATGFLDLDSLTGGFKPGQMIVVAGRPGTGKSTLALDVTRHAVFRLGARAVFFSLEMSRKELQDRLLSAEGRIALHHINTPHGMTAADWDAAARVLPRMAEVPLTIDRSPSMTVAQIRARCQRLRQRHGRLDLIVVDYVQLVEGGGRRRYDNRVAEVSDITRGLKILAKEMEVPLIALSQLNRNAESRSDGRPEIGDLRESGSLEQDSDIVILLYRPDTREKESSRSGEADLIVAKHRNGPTATITVAFQGHYSRFVNMEGGY